MQQRPRALPCWWPLDVSAQRLTTGIGSLPHTDVEAAIKFAFHHGVPFLPQLCARSPREGMIAQALDGLPGLVAVSPCAFSMHAPEWNLHRDALDARLFGAIVGNDAAALASFEPSVESSECWAPFKDALRRCARDIVAAKVQIDGPLTTLDCLACDEVPSSDALRAQVRKLIQAKALAMVRAMHECGVGAVVVFIDEPALENVAKKAGGAGFHEEMAHVRELARILQTKGAVVGLHCCDGAAKVWDAVLALSGVDVVSFDARVSLDAVLASPWLGDFLVRGGTTAVGVDYRYGVNNDSNAVSLYTAPCGLGLVGSEQAAEAIRQCVDGVHDAVFAKRMCGLIQ